MFYFSVSDFRLTVCLRVESYRELLLNREDTTEMLLYLSNELRFAIKDYLVR